MLGWIIFIILSLFAGYALLPNDLKRRWQQLEIVSAADSPLSNTEVQIKQAVNLLGTDVHEATEKLTRVIRLIHDQPSTHLLMAYYHRAFAYIQVNENQKAMSDINNAISIKEKWIWPDTDFKRKFDQPMTDALANIYLQRAGIYERYGEYQKAIQDLDKGYRMKLSKKAQCLFRTSKAELLTKLQKYNESNIELNYVLENTDDATERARLYDIECTNYVQLQKWQEALHSVNKCLQLDPTRNGYMRRAFIYDMTDEPAKSLDDVDRAISMTKDPNAEQLMATAGTRGHLYAQMEEYDKSIAEYTKAINLTQNVAWHKSKFLMERAIVYLGKESNDKAMQDLNLAIQLNPSNSNAYITRSKVYRHMNQLDKALQDCNICLKSCDPTFRAEAYYERSIVQGEMGNIDTAIADCDEAKMFDTDIKFDIFLGILELSRDAGIRPSDFLSKETQDKLWRKREAEDDDSDDGGDGDDDDDYQCSYCKKTSQDKLKKCSRCRTVYYCDVNCQKKGMLFNSQLLIINS
jgi:tetratricopeptide (TPR) repeat protein